MKDKIDEETKALIAMPDDQIDTSDIPETDFSKGVRGKFFKKKKCPVTLIISGGQSGADLAGNEFAESVGIATECNIFTGFRTQNYDDFKLLSRFKRNLVTNATSYIWGLRERTFHNVQKADATAIFVGRAIERTRGSSLTRDLCSTEEKPYVVLDVRNRKTSVVNLTTLLRSAEPKILNIAGERTLRRDLVRGILEDSWRLLYI